MENKSELVAMTADIVSAFVSANSVHTSEIPDLIASVHGALAAVAVRAEAKPPLELVPAVPIKKSVHHDFIICLEDGKPFKSLKRHLRTRYGMTPEEYRAKWGLPADYPIVAPSYAEARSALAKKTGLGRGKAAYGQGGAKSQSDRVITPQAKAKAKPRMPGEPGNES